MPTKEKKMKIIAEIIYQTYINNNKEIFSENYGSVLENLTKMLDRQQHSKLLDLEIEIYESLRLRSIDLILYLLNLICPEQE